MRLSHVVWPYFYILLYVQVNEVPVHCCPLYVQVIEVPVQCGLLYVEVTEVWPFVMDAAWDLVT
jgi:hypothetical protein